MKRLIASVLCLLMLIGTNGLQGIKANEKIVTYTGDAEEEDWSEEFKKSLNVDFVDNKDDVVQKDVKFDFREFYIIGTVPEGKTININNFTLDIKFSDPSFFSEESINSLSITKLGKCRPEITSVPTFSYLHPEKEGTVVLDIQLRNINNSDEVYYAKVSIEIVDPHRGEKLVASKTEFNVSRDELIKYNDYEIEEESKEHYALVLNAIVDEFQLGFMQDDGSIIHDNDISIRTSDASIAGVGSVGWRLPEDMEEPSHLIYLPEYVSTFFTGAENDEAIKQLIEESDCKADGFGGVYSFVRGIIPRNEGTAYITFSYGTQSVKVKVNVSNSNETPIEKIPNDLVNQINNDKNTSVNVSLTTPDTVNKEVFKAAKETGKRISFDIKGKDNKTQYSWTFNGKDISKPDMSLDLGIKFVSNKEVNIRKLVNQENIMFLSFNHHGALPGKALMKINVSEKFNDGEYVYLNYFNEEKGIIESQGDKYLVKDGYVEFTIDHCSEYFLTTKPTVTASTTPTPDTIKDTGNGFMLDATMPIALLSMLIVCSGILIVLNKKRMLHSRYQK